MKTYTKEDLINEMNDTNKHITKISENREMYIDADDLIKDWKDFKNSILRIGIVKFGYEWTEENLRPLE